MKCKQCDSETVKIDTAHGKMVCNAHPVHYWMSGNPNACILTPNGEITYCVLKGIPETAHGIGYTLHTCFQEAQLL
jgi:hypothetical protein